MRRAASLVGLLLLACPRPSAWTGEDLDGRSVDVLADPPAKVSVLVFVRTDCPISNRYSPELRRMEAKYREKGVRFFLVYPDAGETPAQIRAHQREYEISAPAIRDPRHVLVERADVRVTPEVAVLSSTRGLVYRGRIDDQFVAFGRERTQPTTHDLEDAIESTLANRAVRSATTTAVGCAIARRER